MPAVNPFIHRGLRPFGQTVGVLAALAVPAACYSLLYENLFIVRLLGYILLGIAIDTALLRTWKPRSLGGGLTAALMVTGLPPTIPFLPVLLAILLALGVAKHSPLKRLVRFNAAMLGRLFLMLVFNEQTVAYGSGTDAVTTATPLDFYKAEGIATELKKMLFGRIDGAWEFFTFVPGSPGETFPLILMLLGGILATTGILSWRAPVTFLAAFTLTTALLGKSVLFSFLSGAIVFSAVFIVSDPSSTPTSKSGRLLFGLLAGTTTALLRHFTYYTETVVFAILLANLFTPLLDRLAFHWQGRRLARRTL